MADQHDVTRHYEALLPAVRQAGRDTLIAAAGTLLAGAAVAGLAAAGRQPRRGGLPWL